MVPAPSCGAAACSSKRIGVIRSGGRELPFRSHRRSTPTTARGHTPHPRTTTAPASASSRNSVLDIADARVTGQHVVSFDG
jgi:hypothetical protein